MISVDIVDRYIVKGLELRAYLLFAFSIQRHQYAAHLYYDLVIVFQSVSVLVNASYLFDGLRMRLKWKSNNFFIIIKPIIFYSY